MTKEFSQSGGEVKVTRASRDGGVDAVALKILGPNLEKAKNTRMSEKLRRKLLQPAGRFAIWRGRKGYPEYYIYYWDGTKIDATWDSIEPNVSEEVKEFYKKRYRKPFDSAY